MSIAPVRDVVLPRSVAPAPSLPAKAKAQTSDGPSPFARMLEGLGREVQHGEALMRTAIAATHTGIGIAPVELIALQAGVYRYSEAVDLASRLVDRATSSVKTVVQGQ